MIGGSLGILKITSTLWKDFVFSEKSLNICCHSYGLIFFSIFILKELFCRKMFLKLFFFSLNSWYRNSFWNPFQMEIVCVVCSLSCEELFQRELYYCIWFEMKTDLPNPSQFNEFIFVEWDYYSASETGITTGLVWKQQSCSYFSFFEVT